MLCPSQDLCPQKTLDEQTEDRAKSAAMVNTFLDAKSRTEEPVVTTAYMARPADNVAEMARILGRTKDADRYWAIAGRIRGVYSKYLIGRDGVI